MPSDEFPVDICGPETPLYARKRASRPLSVRRMSSVKRRRISVLGCEASMEQEKDDVLVLKHSNSMDRFIPSRPKTLMPLNVTPRTNRIGRQFGLTDSRVFGFKENLTEPYDGNEMLGMLRRSASALFNTARPTNLSSVTETLGSRKQCTMALDGPGVTRDPFAYPISWSRRNLIAIACGVDVFYQDLSTKNVSRLCRTETYIPGAVHTIEWGGKGWETVLALGTTTGVVQLWEAKRDHGPGALLRMWSDEQLAGIGCMDWNDELLAVGSSDGAISLFDVRSKLAVARIAAHKGDVLGLKWNTNGTMIASSDHHGAVYMWDKRKGQHILERGTRGPKMKHHGPAKALAWCPWKPDLLATGSTFPEGKIRIWSSLSNDPVPKPIKTISLDTSILSLHWSPHCRELLSTHGASFEPPNPPPRRASGPQTRPQIKPISTPFSHAIVVHEYPSCKRLLTLTSAHFGPVTHSCLGPDGEDIFTVSPKEETIKKWHVWNKRQDTAKKGSAFDKWSIR